MALLEPWALAGPRVQLRRLRVADLPLFQHYRADPEVGRYQGWQPMDDAAATAFLAEMAEMAATNFCPPGRWCQIAIADVHADALIGDIGLCLAADGEALELGFTLAREWQGSGRAAEAVQLVLQAVWAWTPAQRVLALSDVRNGASVRLLQRLGFRRYATLQAVFRGEPCSEHHFVLHRAGHPDHHSPVLRAATAADADAVARVLVESRAALLPFANAAHTPDEVRAWVAHTLLPAGGVTLALVGGRVQGVLATAVAADGTGWIEQLYVHPTQVGAGLGRALLAAALQALPRPVHLYTFQANVHAREFYERHGFKAIGWGDGSGNEERCPDVLYALA